MDSLYNKIKSALDSGFQELPEVPEYIPKNLNPALELRPYQVEAFGYFGLYLDNKKLRQRPAQLLFHMATGSGKTLVMAGLMLRLYEQGYRNFVFFVNSTTIINKTRENFLNPSSSKYLFNERVYFGDKEVLVREVVNFESANDDDINIVFQTIQGLHSSLNTPKENSVTYKDFENKKIVLISDEAHHINAETKKGKDLSKDEQEEITSWQGTVERIFRTSPDNILLEFTATMDFGDTFIANKYFDKLLYDYPLKQFRKDGYSKEVKVLQTDLPDIQRALQALVLSQYRRKVFEKNKLRIKPVILFKSKTIQESKTFFEKFSAMVKDLQAEQIREIVRGSSDPVVAHAFDYFNANNITLENLAQELKGDFSEEKCVVVNSKEESEEKQISVNTLEDENNEFRAVFAVDKLNEGWDVLNLFDIVRLYNTRDAKSGKPGKTTMSEAQLIGRGARYCPFQLTEEQSKFIRKFDNDLTNEMRIGEELYYHSPHNPQYIQELNTALQEIGIKPKESKQIYLNLKEDFKKSDFYEKGIVFVNERKKYDRSDINGFDSTLITKKHKVSLATGYSRAINLFTEAVTMSAPEKIQKDFHLVNFGERLILKALYRLDFYNFSNLKSWLPNLTSLSEFIRSENYLAKITVEVDGIKEQVENLTPDEKLEIAVRVLNDISSVLETDKVEFKGTKEFTPREIKKVFKDKVMNCVVNEDSDQEFGVSQSSTTNADLYLDLSEKEWYAFNDNFGTSEEKSLVRYINKVYAQLKTEYEKVYLVRNEKHFQLFNFDDGRALEPDFVLFLVKKDDPQTVYYQIFIEPKGSHLIEGDKWKQEFLLRLQSEGKTKVLWESKEYRIVGLPFYNSIISEQTAIFEKSLEVYL